VPWLRRATGRAGKILVPLTNGRQRFQTQVLQMEDRFSAGEVLVMKLFDPPLGMHR
jgi:hypothetical protein